MLTLIASPFKILLTDEQTVLREFGYLCKIWTNIHFQLKGGGVSKNMSKSINNNNHLKVNYYTATLKLNELSV